MSSPSIISRALPVALLLCVSAATAAEPYRYFDDFNAGTQLDPDRWLGTERFRAVANGRLNMRQRELGMQVDNIGYFNSSWNLALANPLPLTQLSAMVAVTDYAVSGCAANANPSVLQARLVTDLFNVGPSVPTSRVGNVVAVVRLARYSNSADAADLVRAEGVIAQCTTTDCNYDSIELGKVDLGTVQLGAAVRLTLAWDPANNQVNFQRSPNPPVSVAYAVPDALAPFAKVANIGTRTNLANCLGGPRTEGRISATFDAVRVNASAAP